MFLSVAACASLPAEKGTADNGSDPGSGLFSLTILHLNDTHSHLDPSPVTTSTGEKLLLGGFPRIATLARSVLNGKDGVFLHGGDAIQGSLYFTRYLGKADVEMLNLLKVDAMTLGNHEFDRGPRLVAELAGQAHFYLVAANIDSSRDSLLSGKIRPHTILKIGDQRVGIIGVACVDTPAISNPGPSVRFLDPVLSVEESVRQLKTEGVDKIILLSHNGYDFDKEIAARIDGLDVIVGGHSHTLLGGKDVTERGLVPDGPYPTVVAGPTGKTVLVVSAWEWGKVLGNLDVTFDGEGDIVAYGGKPLFVDSEVPEDRAVKETSEQFRKGIEELERKVVAKAMVEIPRYEGQRPVLGRLVARAMMEKARQLDPGVAAAFQNGGGVRADIPAGPVTVGLLLTVLPFENTLVLLDLRGDQIRAALKESAMAARKGKIKSPFVTDGLRYTLDENGTVTSVDVREMGGQWLPLEDHRTYRIVTNSYVASGGDFSATIRKANGFRRELPVTDTEAFRDFAAEKRELRPPTDPWDLSLNPLHKPYLDYQVHPAILGEVSHLKAAMGNR